MWSEKDESYFHTCCSEKKTNLKNLPLSALNRDENCNPVPWLFTMAEEYSSGITIKKQKDLINKCSILQQILPQELSAATKKSTH